MRVFAHAGESPLSRSPVALCRFAAPFIDGGPSRYKGACIRELHASCWGSASCLFRWIASVRAFAVEPQKPIPSNARNTTRRGQGLCAGLVQRISTGILGEFKYYAGQEDFLAEMLADPQETLLTARLSLILIEGGTRFSQWAALQDEGGGQEAPASTCLATRRSSVLPRRHLGHAGRALRSEAASRPGPARGEPVCEGRHGLRKGFRALSEGLQAEERRPGASAGATPSGDDGGSRREGTPEQDQKRWKLFAKINRSPMTC